MGLRLMFPRLFAARCVSGSCYAGSKDLRLVRLSNLLNMNAQPFDPATFEPAAEIVYTDARGKPRVILPDYNCIRFRNVTNPDGTSTVRSNSR